jgi:lysophospholipase L1-like esterase
VSTLPSPSKFTSKTTTMPTYTSGRALGMARLVGLALLALSFCGCSPRGLVDADDARIERVGRFSVGARGALSFAWPASQLRLRFEGSALHAEIGDEPLRDETPENDWLALELDGRRASRLQLRSGRHRYELARALAPGPHTLLLSKRTEAEVGSVTVFGFHQGVDTRFLAPPSRRRRRIEVVGDSISAGYGNEGRGPDCGFRAAQEDATRSYAALAARALNAELIVQAWSGKGVYRNHDLRDREPMPEIFARILPARPGSIRSDASFRAHAVIVHLGTNDFWQGPPQQSRFVTAYRELLASLRARSPGALQVLVVSPMLSDDYPHAGALRSLRAWLKALQREQQAAGHRVSLLEQAYAPGEALGCHAHPSVAAHMRFARELTALLRRELGW